MKFTVKIKFLFVKNSISDVILSEARGSQHTHSKELSDIKLTGFGKTKGFPEAC